MNRYNARERERAFLGGGGGLDSENLAMIDGSTGCVPVGHVNDINRLAQNFPRICKWLTNALPVAVLLQLIRILSIDIVRDWCHSLDRQTVIAVAPV